MPAAVRAMISFGTDVKKNAMTNPKMTKPLIVCGRLKGWEVGVTSGRCGRRRNGCEIMAGHCPDKRVGATQGKQHRRDAPENVTAEFQPGNLGDHHVLRIADQRGCRADVAGHRQRDEERDGVELPTEQGGPHHRREDKTDNVVVQKCRQPRRDQHESQQKPCGVVESC